LSSRKSELSSKTLQYPRKSCFSYFNNIIFRIFVQEIREEILI
jgi:hypothetical protein